MITELISVGTEILLGNIVNTNSAYLSEKCALLGLSVYYQDVVGDNEGRMRDVIRTALDRSDVVILTGGLGPTEDDITKEVTADLMGMPLKEDSHSRKLIDKYLKEYEKNNPQRRITKNNYKQAMVPEGAIVLDNHNGTAPGLILEKKGKTAILLPGPPNELKPMFEEYVVPYLQKNQPEIIVSQMVKISGIGESQVAEEIQDLIESQTNPTIAPYAKTGEVHLRVTASAENEKACRKLIKPVVKELKKRFGENVFATDESKTLEEAVIDLLKEKDLKLSLAESLTGGMIAQRIVNVSGASEVFGYGFVTYAEAAKAKLLGVDPTLIEQYNVVSGPVAVAMAYGALQASGADLAVGITGIAGPGGALPGKPIGTVYLAGADARSGKAWLMRLELGGYAERSIIRTRAALYALDLLRRMALDIPPENAHPVPSKDVKPETLDI